MITIKDILKRKGNDYYSIGPTEKVDSALQKMTNKNVGSLIVLENEKIVGIISERDYVRKISKLRDGLVKDFMSSPAIYISPDTTITECMHIMTTKHIRHLPVVDVNVICGIVSIGDVVNAVIHYQSKTIQNLENYITGERYGA